MFWLLHGVALLAAVGIIMVGVLYLANPKGVMLSFGLPLPEEGPNLAWWLRLKGVRDIAAGLVVLAVMVWSETRTVGIVLLTEAFIPAGDLALVLAAKGSVRAALGIHGLTAGLMIAAALALVAGYA